MNIYIYTILEFEFAVLLPCLKTNPPEHPIPSISLSSIKFDAFSREIYQNEAIEREKKISPA